MRFVAYLEAKLSPRSLLVLVAVFGSFCVFTFGITVHAVNDTTVQTIVNSGAIVPALTVDGSGSSLSVTSLPYKLSGTVNAISQIQVYIDGVFSVTIPLSEGETSFSYDLVVPSGSHAVKLVGISPFANINPADSLTLIYTPESPSAGVTNSGSSGSVTTTVAGGGGATITRSLDGSSAPLPSTQQGGLPEWFHTGLVALDLARPGVPINSDSMLHRFSLVFLGLSTAIFPTPILSAYRWIRYSWLGWRKRPLPEGLRRHSVGYIRSFGLTLLVVVFWFL